MMDVLKEVVVLARGVRVRFGRAREITHRHGAVPCVEPSRERTLRFERGFARRGVLWTARSARRTGGHFGEGVAPKARRTRTRIYLSFLTV